MTALLTHQAELRYQRAVEIGQKLGKAGVANAFEETKNWQMVKSLVQHYARYLVQIGKVSSENQAFKKIFITG